MLDPDDVEAIMLERALTELVEDCKGLADPEQGLRAFFEAVYAVLLYTQAPGRPFSWILLVCARRVSSEIRASL